MPTLARSRTGQQLAAAAGAQVILLAALEAGVGLGVVGWLVGTGYFLVLCVSLRGAARRAGAGTLGPAGAVTLARAVLVGGVSALVADRLGSGGAPVLTLVALAVVALALDAVDGPVARRTGTASALGARFDMEVDAFLILVLSVHVAVLVGPWALVIGALRYGFVAAGRALAWMRAPLPARYSAKAVAALQGIALMVATAEILPRHLTVALVAAALASLVWSFGRDVVWLWRRAHPPGTPGVIRVGRRRSTNGPATASPVPRGHRGPG